MMVWGPNPVRPQRLTVGRGASGRGRGQELVLDEVADGPCEGFVGVAAHVDAVGPLRRAGREVLHVDVEVEDQGGDLLDLAGDGHLRPEPAGVVLGAAVAGPQVGALGDVGLDRIGGDDGVAPALRQKVAQFGAGAGEPRPVRLGERGGRAPGELKLEHRRLLRLGRREADPAEGEGRAQQGAGCRNGHGCPPQRRFRVTLSEGQRVGWGNGRSGPEFSNRGCTQPHLATFCRKVGARGTMTRDSFDFGEVDPESSILLLGAGFSLGAINIANEQPPNGRGLRRHFIQQLNLPGDTDYDLQVLTEEFAEDNAKKLRDELYKIFRLKSLSEDQKAVLNKSWRRIYSTNYDDAVELHRLSSKTPPNAFDVSESVPNKLPHGAAIHLHGSIRLITAENVRESLVLGEASYVNQYVVRSPWYDQFQRDLAFASALYIVGYSLADYHIAGLLMANPKFAERTIFIQGPDPDSTFVRRTARYGRTMFIGTSGFADALARAPRPAAPSLNNLRSFSSLAPTRDKKASARPTAAEVYDLLVYGNFDPGRLARSQPSEDYAIARAEAVGAAADAVESKAALVIDGRLGNGKSVFLHLLAFELSSRGWRCLLLRPGHPDLQRDVAALINVERVIVFIEQYSAAQDALRGLRNALPKAKLVVEVRTGTFEVRFHELAELLPEPFDRVSLNALSRAEVLAFRRLCDSAGLRVPSVDRASDLRDLLLEMFQNTAIRDRIRAALAPLFEKRATRRILTMTMLIATHQGAVGAAFVRSVIGEDPFTALKPLQDLSHEIFETSADGFKARSPVFSSFVITAFIDPEEIADAVVQVTLAAAKRRGERPYRILMSNMMAYSSLRRTLQGKGELDTLIISIYEKLRYDERINSEPLFWLQYAIAMASIHRLETADEYIITAYRKAKDIPGFQNYQIDTQAFRIALLRAIDQKSGQKIFNIQAVLEGLERVDAMLSDSSHRAYAVRVLDGVQPFVTARRADLTAGERTALQFWLLKIAKSLALLPEEYKISSGSETTRTRIDAVAATFIK